MAGKALDVKIRLERQEKKILQLTKKLEEAKDQYEVQAYQKSKRSLEEVIDFMKGKADI